VFDESRAGDPQTPDTRRQTQIKKEEKEHSTLRRQGYAGQALNPQPFVGSRLKQRVMTGGL
jgi:hypothetical protein